MTLYLVTVDVGVTRRKYFDSIWVQWRHADERRRQLHDEFIRVGIAVAPESGDLTARWEVTLTVAHCLDGELREKPGPKPKAENERSAQSGQSA